MAVLFRRIVSPRPIVQTHGDVLQEIGRLDPQKLKALEKIARFVLAELREAHAEAS